MGRIGQEAATSAVLVPLRAARGAHATVARSVDTAVRDDLDEVFRLHYRAVVGAAARVLGSPTEAEDVAQEVFLAFGRSSVPADEARGWLAVAAVHTALNLHRSRRRREARELRVTESSTRSGQVGDVADAVLAAEERDRMRAALAQLPEKQAVALILRHSGFSYAEVAAALDLAVGSVGTTVRRAEAALRKEVVSRAAP